MMPRVLVIILVFNGRKWIDNCLNSVLQTDYPNYAILVIDNASGDGSAAYIAEKFPQVELIKNKKNCGFAEGNNIGIRYALGRDVDYVALLNQDTKVEPNWITELVRVAENDPKIAILSPMQYDYEGSGLDINFKKLIQNTPPDKDFVETVSVIGAAMLYRLTIARKVGLFDPIYFCYHEETDLCRRVKYFCYKVGIVKASKIYHWHSLIQENGLDTKTNDLFMRNELIYALKNPNKMLVRALLGYFKRKIMDSIKKYGILNGLKEFFMLAIKQFPVLFYFPRIVARKNREISRLFLSNYE